MPPTISAVVPTYNRASYVCRAIDSILDQSVQPDQIIVVDDGSSDGTASLLRSRYGDRLQVIEQANGGVSAARRTGLQAASGDWIAFLDSDDEWLPGRLEAMARLAEGLDEGVVCLFGDTVVRRDNDADTTLFTERSFQPGESLTVFHDAVPTQFPYMFALLQSSLLRREALVDTGAFQEGFRSSEDFLVIFRLALRHGFAAIPEAVTRLYRTEDLMDSSLDHGQDHGADYYRVRVIAFREAWEARGDEVWRKHYGHVARRLTQVQLKDGANAIPAALQQFRFGISPHAIAWTLAALAGPLVPRRTAARRDHQASPRR